MSRDRKTWRRFAAAAITITLLAGCGSVRNSGSSGLLKNGQLLSPEETYEKEGKSFSDGRIRDKAALYREEDGITTFYLTVGLGNSEDGTDHTWQEVNANSKEFYEEAGVEPFSCEALLQAGDEAGPLPGELGYGETTANASVRIRGDGASRQAQKSYRITLREGKGKWNGQKAILLNKYVTDPMRFTDKLACDLMAGIPELMSTRTRFVRLYVKDRTEGEDGPFVDYGLYTQVEAVNKTYLKNRDLDRNGSLFQADEWEEFLESQGESDRRQFLALKDRLADESVPVRELIHKYLEEDNLYYWLAFQMLIGNPKAAEGSFYLYNPLGSERWFFISWNSSDAFSSAYKRLSGKTEKSWERGIYPFAERTFFSRVFRDEECREELWEAVEDLADNYLTEDIIEEYLNRYASLTKERLYALPDRMFARVSQEDYEKLLGEMAGEIQKNMRAVKESLEGPWPFHILDPEASEGGITFRWEDAFVWEGKAAYSLELARGYSFESCLVKEEEVAGISYQIPALPPGQYFLRIRAKSPAGYVQDAREVYYSENGAEICGTVCFYVNADGTVEVSRFYEDE